MAVALGACIFEKHITLTPGGQSPDDAFAVSPHTFREYVQTIHAAHAAMRPRQPDEASAASYRRFRPSIRAIRDIKNGELFTRENIAVVRPGGGLPAGDLKTILDSRCAVLDLECGTAIRMEQTCRYR
jgi:sialic acid synthase SpsE